MGKPQKESDLKVLHFWNTILMAANWILSTITTTKSPVYVLNEVVIIISFHPLNACGVCNIACKIGEVDL